MTEEPRCKCGHPDSVHTEGRAEKRAKLRGTMVSDVPSGREGQYNSCSGKTDGDACSVPDCICTMLTRG